MANISKSCPICKCSISSIQHLLGHLCIFHASDPNFNVPCGLSGCTTTSRTFSGFYSPIDHHHSEVISKRGNYILNFEDCEELEVVDTDTIAPEFNNHIDQGTMHCLG